MKRIHLWVTAIVAVAILCLSGCKKDKPLWVLQTPPVSNQPDAPEKYLAVKITGADFTTIYSYNGNSKNLRNIRKFNAQSDSSFAVFYNELNQPLYLNMVVNGYIVSQTEYTLNEKGEVIKGDVYNVETDGWDWKATTLKAFYTLTYNSLSQLTQVNYFDETGTKVSEALFDYNTEGNISGIKSSGNINLEYDNFNGIGRSLNYLYLYYVEAGDHLLFYSKNNPVKLNETLRTYKYNEDKYPVEMSIASPGDTSVYSIEYNVE